MRALKSGPCLRRGPKLRVSPQRRLSRRAVLRRVRLHPATRPRVPLHRAHRASREVLIAEAAATIQIVAAVGMILIGVIGTATLVDVAILAVAQSTRRAAEFAVVTAMAAAIGATERQSIPARSIRCEILIKIRTGAEIGIQIAVATGIV